MISMKRLLVIIICLIIASNILWIVLDQSPPMWDIAGHSSRAALYAHLLSSGKISEILQYDTIYPPLPYLITAVFFLLFGWHVDVPQYSLLFWLILFAGSLYSLAKTLAQNKIMALLSVILALLFPLLAHFSRIYLLDFPLTAMITACLAALLKTKYFTDRKWTIIFSILVGLSLLTKWTAIIFLIGPIIFYLMKAPWKKILLNLSLALLIILIIAGPWYFIHGGKVLSSSEDTRNNIFSVPYENLLSLSNAFYYFNKTVDAVSWPVSLFILAGVVYAIYKKNIFLLLWIAVPYLILTFALYSKESRYFLPAFPALAIITVNFFWQIKYKKIILPILFGISIIFWLQISWHLLVIPKSSYKFLHLNNAFGFKKITTQWLGYGFIYPTAYKSDLDNVVKIIKNDMKENKIYHVVVVPNSMFLTVQQLQYYAQLNNLNNIDYSLSPQLQISDWKSTILQADYLITKTGEQGPNVWNNNLGEIAEEESQPNSEIFARFTLISSWNFPGLEKKSQQMRLYRRN